LIVLLVLLFFQTSSLHAHPHAFVAQRLEVVFDDKGVSGIGVWWKFDDMFASMIAEDHDLNKNGMLEPDEVKGIKANAFEFISEHSYFTFVKIDGRPFPVKWITNFNATLDGNRLVYEFFIPCHVTADQHFKRLVVASYDPTYYTAIFFTRGRPVSLKSEDGFEVKAAIREDPDTKIYFDMVNPWALFLEFRKK